MPSFERSLLSVFGTALLVACSAMAQTVDTATTALSTKTYVSYRGVDTNPCNRVFPCRTITHALTMTAVSGFVDILDDGDYDSFTASQSVTVAAAPGVFATVNSASSGNSRGAISISGGDVVLRNLHINATSNEGVFITSPGKVSMEQMWISSHFAGVEIQSAGTLSIINSTIQNCSQGILVDFGASTVTIVDVKILDSSFDGLDIFDGSVTFKHSVEANAVFDGAVVTGIAGSGSPKLVVEDSLLTGNAQGVDVGGGGCGSNCGTLVLSNSTITNNTSWGVGILGTAYTRGNNTFFGNGFDFVNGSPTPLAPR